MFERKTLQTVWVMKYFVQFLNIDFPRGFSLKVVKKKENL